MQSYPVNSTKVQSITNEFIRSVYNWMGIGLALTGLIAYYVSTDISIQNLIFGNKLVFFGLIIGELALVFFHQCKNWENYIFNRNISFHPFCCLKRRYIIINISRIYEFINHYNFLHMFCNFYLMQHLWNDNKTRSNFSWRFYDHGFDWNYYRFRRKHFYTKLCNGYDNQLHWSYCICWFNGI